MRFPARAASGLSLFSALLVLVSCGQANADGNEAGDETGAGGDAVTSEVESGAARASMALPIIAQEARVGDLVLRVNTKGGVYGDRVVALTAEVGGTVKDVLVRPGARVSAGQTLVQLDAYPFDLAVRAAQATLDEREQAFRESFAPESLVTGIGPTPEQRKALRIRSGVASAEVNLEKARWERERAVITAPVNGTVDRIDLAVGERIGAGAAIATIVDLGALRIEAQVLEHDLPLIRVGGEAVVTSAAVPGRSMRGRIDAVLPLVDSVTRIGRVLVRVPGETALRPGMYADVQLEAAAAPGPRDGAGQGGHRTRRPPARVRGARRTCAMDVHPARALERRGHRGAARFRHRRDPHRGR